MSTGVKVKERKTSDRCLGVTALSDRRGTLQGIYGNNVKG